MEWMVTIGGYIAAAITGFATIVVTINSRSKDASEKAYKATIESQDTQIATVTNERDLFKAKYNEAEGQAKALQNIVTQAPEIAGLTAEVTKLVSAIQEQIASQRKRDEKMFGLLNKALNKGDK